MMFIGCKLHEVPTQRFDRPSEGPNNHGGGRHALDHANPRLLAMLKLFCGMLVFNRGCRGHVLRLARAGRYEPKIEKQEAIST